MEVPKNKMMKISLCLIILLFSIKSPAQTKQEISCWEAKAINPGYSDRIYQLMISKDSVFIHINNQYKYAYKLYGKKEKQYFKLGNEKFFIDRKEDKMRITYGDDKLRIAVNEIVDVNFRKCDCL
jgi:hypothetical protein